MLANNSKTNISDNNEKEFQRMSRDVQKELQKAGYLDKKGRLISSHTSK